MRQCRSLPTALSSDTWWGKKAVLQRTWEEVNKYWDDATKLQKPNRRICKKYEVVNDVREGHLKFRFVRRKYKKGRLNGLSYKLNHLISLSASKHRKKKGPLPFNRFLQKIGKEAYIQSILLRSVSRHRELIIRPGIYFISSFRTPHLLNSLVTQRLMISTGNCKFFGVTLRISRST